MRTTKQQKYEIVRRKGISIYEKRVREHQNQTKHHHQRVILHLKKGKDLQYLVDLVSS